MLLSEEEPDTREEYESGPWIASVRTRSGVTFYPRNPSRLPRWERLLPSGDVIVDDVHEGLVLRTEYYAAANLQLLKPLGRRLGDRRLIQMQQSESEWYVFTYQDQYGEDDQLVQSTLRLIERHRGQRLEETLELRRA